MSSDKFQNFNVNKFKYQNYIMIFEFINIETGIQSSLAWLSTVFYCFEETTNKL